MASRQILEDMGASGVAHNALTAALLIEHHVVLGDAHAAFAQWEAALAAGVAVRRTSLERLMSRCERSGEQALLVRRCACSHACKAACFGTAAGTRTQAS